MNSYLKLKVKYKKKSRRKKKIKIDSPSYLKRFELEIKNLSPSNWSKILIVLGLLFLIISYNFTFHEIKKKFTFNQKIDIKTENNITVNFSRYLLEQINLPENKLKFTSIEICNEKNTKHICYINEKGYYNNILYNKDNVICSVENIVLDPSKLVQKNIFNNNFVGRKNKRFTFFSKGFINTKCTPDQMKLTFNNTYKNYFNSWNYDYNIENEKETFEELAPGKTALLIWRNEISFNILHSYSEIFLILYMMNLFNLSQEEVQIMIFSGKEIQKMAFNEIYKTLFPKGNEPIYIANLKKKYKISKAINILFPNYNSIMRNIQIFHDLIDKYINITSFKDTFISDDINYYYPDITVKSYGKRIKFIKSVTIQWDKICPIKRKNQTRLEYNTKELADKLAQKLPSNILIRLINITALPYKAQISLMRNTDYLLGFHETILPLSIFLPKNAILHEIYQKKKNNLFTNKSSFIRRVIYSDLFKFGFSKDKDNENEILDNVLQHMKDNNFF